MIDSPVILQDTLTLSYLDLGGAANNGWDVMPKLFEFQYDFSSAQSSFLSAMSYNPFFSDYVYHVSEQSLPWLFEKATRDNSTCPAGHDCVDTGYGNGMFVRDTYDNKIYFSDAGWARYESGADTDWLGVAEDLIYITGGVLGGVAAGPIAILGGFLSLGAWAINYFVNGPSK